MCLEELERHAEARVRAEQSLELWPACPDGLYSLAWIAVREGRFDDAEVSLANMRERSPLDTREPELREQVRVATERMAYAVRIGYER